MVKEQAMSSHLSKANTYAKRAKDAVDPGEKFNNIVRALFALVDAIDDIDKRAK